MAAEEVVLLDQWFDRGRALAPGGPALRVGRQTLTYEELDAEVTALAGPLAAAGSRRVGVLAAKSVSAYAGFLAALRAGACAVPLAPDAPPDRLAAVAAAACLDAVVVDATGAAALPALLPGLAPGTLLVTALPQPADLPPGIRLRRPGPPGPLRVTGRGPDDLAYLMFTSGSTGTPKGVPIRHRNISAFVRTALERYEVGPGDRFSQIYELTFDLSMSELFLAWGSGACLCVLNRIQALSPARLADQRITVWHATPSLAASLHNAGRLPPGCLPDVRTTVFCGEPLTSGTARAWHGAAPGSVIDNLYGPTEASVACTGHVWDADGLPDDATVPIGREFPGVHTLVVGADGAPADTGELCLRGEQVFTGYLDPAEDEGRFLDHDGHRWYRTGDLVRRDAGAMTHLGRTDTQVKVQGYRVEIGEVSAALRAAAPGAQVAVLTVDGDTGPQLVACLMGGPPVAQADVLGRAARRLPAYMLPRMLWWLPEPVLNANGKIDRPLLRRAAQRRLASSAPSESVPPESVPSPSAPTPSS
ncbi:amino acid adenylation domain-containing protein [Streptomyces goshikiensis]|uniref:amino acid adenylation domain-containing protein n=1 Tax=Streptomyces goshikiensis TaxID=1942 RepID=UPI0037D3CB3D